MGYEGLVTGTEEASTWVQRTQKVTDKDGDFAVLWNSSAATALEQCCEEVNLQPCCTLNSGQGGGQHSDKRPAHQCWLPECRH